MMTNCITNTYLTYQIDLPSLWNFPACWLSLCEEIVEDLDMACGHGNLLTLGCCTSWPQLAPAGPRWVKQPIKTLMCLTFWYCGVLHIDWDSSWFSDTSILPIISRLPLVGKLHLDNGC